MKKQRELLFLGLAIITMVAFTGCGATTVNLNKYIAINADGYDTMGTASYVFDYNQFEKDYSNKIKLNSKNSNELTNLGLLVGKTAEELLMDTCVSQKLDKTSGLCNGDKVTLKWNCEDTMAKEYFNVSLKYSDIEYEVTGLEEVESFNPFDYVTVSFTGTSPNGTVIITSNYDQKEMQYITFTSDKDSNLKTDDSVTITASISGSAESFVEKFGSTLSKTEQDYVVGDLDSYITDISDVPSDMYNKMDSQLQDVLFADFASWNNETLKDMKLLGNYVITLKDGMFGTPNNYVYFVYKITAENDKSNGDFNYYWYGYYQDVVNLKDGTCSVDMGSYTVSTSGWFSPEIVKFDGQGSYQYYGFKDLDTLFNNHVVAKIEKYEYKSTVQE